MGLFKNKKKKGFPFSESENVAVISCQHVMNDGEPIVFASHDEDDGCWQFLCGKDHAEADAMVVALSEVYERDNSLAEVSSLPFGCVAEREFVGASWQVFSNL